ncbi:MAG TPA: glycosyltransferase family 2 protein [bacterium]|nr:glycosyltransferase family 2 protein [Candidatus Pacearchaeota archaeon]HPO11357.1 glycosyltransferase family 2 protein [bacterium]
MISVIIVNYNGKKWLEKCLNSIFDQTYRDYEVIFVDNNSSDDSIDFVNNRYGNESNLKVIKSDKNLGFAGGNNLGIKYASGEHILLLNNDTYVEENFLEKLVDFYNNNSFNLVGCKQRNYYSKELINDIIGTIDIFGFPTPNKLLFGSSGYCMLISKKDYVDSMGLDNNFFMYCEDIDWFWRLNLLNKKMTISDVYIYHASGGSSGEFKSLNYKVFLWRNQNTLQMLLKNYSWYNLLWILPIYFIQNIFEIIFFLLILKPKIAFSYIEGWWFNIKNFDKIIEKRKWVQNNRKIPDSEIFKKMYFGSGKVKTLLNYIKNK